MSELLIVFVLLAVGKIHGQETVVPPVINLRSWPVPTFGRKSVSHREYEFQTSPPPLRLYTNAPRQVVRDHVQITSGSEDLNLPSLTVRMNQPKRKLFTSSKVPRKTYPALNDTVLINNAVLRNNANKQVSNDVYADIFEKNNSVISGDTANSAVEKTIYDNSENVSAVKPDSTYLNDTKLPEVVLDERSNFNGDQCPEGFAKVNGQCVKKD